MPETTNDGPLSGVRVIDLGHALAGPFGATLLGDFGADIIKVERPGSGDSARSMGPRDEKEGPVWWKSLARNKRSIALDWTKAEGKKVLRRLVESSNVLIENFRPGVLERHGIGPKTLMGWNSDLVVVRISGYGQFGPYSHRPGFGKAAEAISGLAHITGFPDGPPLHPGFPMADMTTGLMAAYGSLVALYAVKSGKAKGQVIDLPIYETPLRLIDFPFPIRTASSYVPTRVGNRQPMSFGLSGIFQSKDGRWVTYSCATYSVAARLLKLVGADEMLSDPRFGTLHSLSQNDEKVNQLVEAWMGQRTAAQILEDFDRAEAVAAVIYDTDDILSDPHIQERGNVIKMPGEQAKVVGVVPQMNGTPGKVRWLGPAEIGANTAEILRGIGGLEDAEIARLAETGAIALSEGGD